MAYRLVVLGTLKRDAANLIDFGGKVVDVVLLMAHHNLGGAGSTEAEHSEQRQYIQYLFHQVNIYYSINHGIKPHADGYTICF